MTLHQHLSFGFPNRPFVARGEDVVWMDGLPAPTQAEMDEVREAAEAALLVASSIPNCKVWPSVQEFISEFNFGELAAISLSKNIIIAAMRMILATWRGEVHSNDSRVISGIDECVSEGILSEERKSIILGIDNELQA
jgi:hypothetical protein